MIATVIIGTLLAFYCALILYRMFHKKSGCAKTCGGCASASLCHTDVYKEWQKDHGIEESR